MPNTDALTVAKNALNSIASSDLTATVDDLRSIASRALAEINPTQTTPLAAVAVSGSRDVPYELYSDGACRGNPGKSAWGIVIVQNGKVLNEEGGFIGHATNQVAEMTAALAAMSRIPKGATATLYSDSQYTLKGLTEWRKGWLSRGWKTAGGDPVKNKELWMQLYAVFDERKIKTQWVKGHSGVPLNERCDQLANEAIEQNQ